MAINEITVANLDWEILDDLTDALADATIGAEPVFAYVAKAATQGHVFAEQLRGPQPIAAVNYTGTIEDFSPEGIVGQVLSAEIWIAARLDAKADESDRLKECLRLINAAKNAVHNQPPSDATAWGDENFYHERITWDKPRIDLTERNPWIVAVLPVELCWTLANTTSH